MFASLLSCSNDNSFSFLSPCEGDSSVPRLGRQLDTSWAEGARKLLRHKHHAELRNFQSHLLNTTGRTELRGWHDMKREAREEQEEEQCSSS